MASISPTTLSPEITPEAAVPPNSLRRLSAFLARSSSEVPAAPRCLAMSSAACRSEATIWSPVSMSARTTMYVAPPTTVTTATTVIAAASDFRTFMLSSRR